MADLAAYWPRIAPPQTARRRGRQVCTVPGAGGGLTVMQQLRVLEGFDPAAAPDDAALIHLLVEVSKVCWRERLTRMGDPNFVPLDPANELGDVLVQALRAEVADGLRSPQPAQAIGPPLSELKTSSSLAVKSVSRALEEANRLTTTGPVTSRSCAKISDV